MYSIRDIAQLITEDPDIFCDDMFYEDIFFEASPDKYVNYFNKSEVRTKVAQSGDVDRLRTTAFGGDPRENMPVLNVDQHGFPNPTDKEGNGLVLLRDLSPEQKIALVERIQSVVDPKLVKFEQYFVRQVATGALGMNKIEEDSGRLNETVAKFIKHSRKAYWKAAGHSKSILDFPDWRELERIILKIEEENIEFDDSDQNVWFSKTYTNNAMALLLGEKPEAVKYWFREVTCYDDSKKYGAGSQWCTRNSHSLYDSYSGNGGLYIIEMQTSTKKRTAIFQLSGSERMDREDSPVSQFGPRLSDFGREVLSRFKDKMHPKSAEELESLIQN